MRKWQCVVCGFIYDEALGLPDEGIAPASGNVIFNTTDAFGNSIEPFYRAPQILM